jgi:hypothetical protein
VCCGIASGVYGKYSVSSPLTVGVEKFGGNFQWEFLRYKEMLNVKLVVFKLPYAVLALVNAVMNF